VLGAHAEARSEMRLRVKNSRGMQTYMMDRVLRDCQGRRWIIDFKSSRHEGAGIEDFLDEECKRYEGQLNGYAAAFDDAFLGLYFPLLKAWREWRR